MQGRYCVRGRDLLSRQGRHFGGADRGGSDPHAQGAEGDISVSCAGAADRQPLLGASAASSRDAVHAAPTASDDPLAPPIEASPLPRRRLIGGKFSNSKTVRVEVSFAAFPQFR